MAHPRHRRLGRWRLDRTHRIQTGCKGQLRDLAKRPQGRGDQPEAERIVPRQEELTLDPNAAYLHYTTNNTIFGTEFHYVPDAGPVNPRSGWSVAESAIWMSPLRNASACVLPSAISADRLGEMVR